MNRGGPTPEAAAAGSRFPRLLLLSDEGPNLRTAGGLQLYRLLEDYPADLLRVIERNANSERSHLACRYESLRMPWRRFEQSRFHRWKRSLRGLGLVPPVALKTIDELLGGFRPELVMCVMQHAAYYDTAWRYARLRKLPLIVIVHDVNEQFEPVLPMVLPSSRRRDAAFYRYASRRLCISPEMEALCAELYGVRGDVMYPMRSMDLQPRPFAEAARLKSPGRLTIGFVGNLNYGYGEGLLQMLPALRATGSRLVMFGQAPGPSRAALLDAVDCCEFRGFTRTPEEAWHAIKDECDAVIMPYPNPAGTMEKLYRHHFPSKLPEYLALGMPVIVTGPDYATGVTWAKRHPDAAICYASTDLEGLSRIFERLRDDADYRLGLAKAGYLAGNEDFDPSRIKANFMSHVRAATAVDDISRAV